MAPADRDFPAAILAALAGPRSQWWIILMCFAFALLGSAAYLFFAETLDHSVKHGAMLRRGLPPDAIYVGSIPRMLT